MTIERTKKGELLNMRADIQKLIQRLNGEFIRGSANYDSVTRDVALDVREELIKADNLINAYRLRGW